MGNSRCKGPEARGGGTAGGGTPRTVSPGVRKSRFSGLDVPILSCWVIVHSGLRDVGRLRWVAGGTRSWLLGWWLELWSPCPLKAGKGLGEVLAEAHGQG